MTYGLSQSLAGDRDRKINLFRLTQTVNDLGEPEELYEQVSRLWAKVRHQALGPDSIAADAPRARRMTKFYVSWRSDISERDRIEHDNQMYKIVGIAELGRRDLLELSAEYIEGLNNG